MTAELLIKKVNVTRQFGRLLLFFAVGEERYGIDFCVV